jgi:FMN phosphatase YigB (HAD superfamily)
MAGRLPGRRRMPCWWCDASSRGVAGLLLHAGRPQRPGQIPRVRRLRPAARPALDPGELYRRYTEIITSKPAQDAGPGFVPYRTSWLAAGRRLLAPFGRQSAAGQFADAYADLHATAVIFPEVPDAVQALARHVRIAAVANADHDYLMRCLNHNGLRFDLVVDSETARCCKPDPQIFQRARPCRCPWARR